MHGSPGTGAPESTFGIAAVERDTGLSKDTLRVWERRYGFPSPERNARGDRVYSREQVEKLRLLRRLMDQGRRPSRIVGLDIEALLALLDSPRSTPPAEGGLADRALLELVKLHLAVELRTALHQLLLKQGLERFVTATVAPLSVLVGECWMRGEIDVPGEHLFTEQVQNVLRSAIGTLAVGDGRPRILLTTLPDELHALGLLMAEAILVPEGASCVSLGTQTPLGDIPAAAAAGGFDVVALSFSAAYPARQAVAGIASLRGALPAGIELWAGGAAVKGKQRKLPGVRVISEIEQAAGAMHEWRRKRIGGVR